MSHAPSIDAFLTPFELSLVDSFQHGMPISPAPYRDMAEQLSCSQEDVIKGLQALVRKGVLSRIGPVFEHRLAGASTLAAMSVPQARLDEVARIVSALHEVNHNYQRSHHWNLWFVMTAANRVALDDAIARLESATGLPVLDLPMEQSYCIDLGFPVGLQSRVPA